MRSFVGLFLCTVLAMGQSLSGRRAPSFSLPDSTITQHDILDYRGKWLLLDFMKTDCPHCAVLSKTLEQIKTQFGPKVGILSVLISPPETTTTLALCSGKQAHHNFRVRPGTSGDGIFQDDSRPRELRHAARFRDQSRGNHRSGLGLCGLDHGDPGGSGLGARASSIGSGRGHGARAEAKVD
jgi:hypothetical protein